MKRIVIAASLIAGWSGCAEAQFDPNAFMNNVRGLGRTAHQLAHGPDASNSSLSATGPSNGTASSGSLGMIPDQIEPSYATDTELASVPVRAGQVSTFEVMGLKLGMSIKEARRVAVQKRFHPAGYSSNPDFDSRVRAKMSATGFAPAHNIVTYATPKTDDGGHLTVQFDAMPDGARINSIFYGSPAHGRTPQEIYQAIVARYGKPTTVTSNSSFVTAQWCEGGKPNIDCGDFPTNLRLTINPDEFNINLSNGIIKGQAYLKSIDDRAHALQRSKSSGVSF